MYVWIGFFFSWFLRRDDYIFCKYYKGKIVLIKKIDSDNIYILYIYVVICIDLFLRCLVCLFSKYYLIEIKNNFVYKYVI